MIPLGDSPNPRGFPIGTYLLIAINVAVFVFISVPLLQTGADPRDPNTRLYADILRDNIPNAKLLRRALSDLSAYDIFVFVHGFKPHLPEADDLLASLFLHAGFVHLFGNMLFLWIYGDNVEHRLGTLRYLFIYVACGIAATLFHAFFALGSSMPLIGASGAISGILGFYFKWFPRNKVRMLVPLLLMSVILVPARVVLLLYFVMDNLIPFMVSTSREGGGVAYGAHLGGFISGLVVATWLDRRELRHAPAGFDPEARTIGIEPRGRSLSELIEAGDYGAAAERYFALPAARTSGALTPASSIQLGNWLREQGHAHAALSVYRRHLRDFPRGPGRAEAHLGAGTTQLREFGEQAAAYQHFLDALDSDPDSETATQARAGLATIAARQGTARRRR